MKADFACSARSDSLGQCRAMKPPFVSLLIICLIAFVFVSAAPAEQHIEVRTMREAKQVFSSCAAPHILLLSATTQSVKIMGFYRLTVSPTGDVTQVRVIRSSAETAADAVKPHGLSKGDVIMLQTLVKWKANPSTMTRIVDVKLVPFLEGGR